MLATNEEGKGGMGKAQALCELQINDVDSDQAYDFLGGSILADMDASDTAQVKFYQPNGSQTTHIHHGQTWFNGYLAC